MLVNQEKEWKKMKIRCSGFVMHTLISVRGEVFYEKTLRSQEEFVNAKQYTRTVIKNVVNKTSLSGSNPYKQKSKPVSPAEQ